MTPRLDGAVAQLGERRVRNAEVRGSTPLGSTSPPDASRKTLFSVSSRARSLPSVGRGLIFKEGSKMRTGDSRWGQKTGYLPSN
jgi:hypothetical protein